MGLFSRKKKTYVSSQTFNLGGNYADRTNFAKTVVIGGVLRDVSDKRGIGEVISGNYLSGPGIKLKSYSQWLERNNYWGAIRQSRYYISNPLSVDNDVISKYVNKHGGSVAYINDVDIGYPSPSDYVFKYMLDNFPEFEQYINYSDEEYDEIGFDFDTSDSSNSIPVDKILIKYDGKEFYIPYNHTNTSMYITALYTSYELKEDELNIVLEEDDDFPDMEDWTLVDDGVVEETAEYIFKTIKTTILKDGTIEEEVLLEEPIEITTLNGTKAYEFYENGEVAIEEKHKYIEKVEELIEEEIIDIPEEDQETIESITITTTTYNKVSSRSAHNRLVGANLVPVTTRVFMYQYGSGIAELDKFFEPDFVGKSPFYPVMPVRTYKRNISANYYSGLYKLNKQGYRKLTDQLYPKFVKQLNSSKGIGDINTGFMQFGVALNTKDEASMEYIYHFFDHYMEMEKAVPNADSWVDQYAKFDAEEVEIDKEYSECLARRAKQFGFRKRLPKGEKPIVCVKREPIHKKTKKMSSYGIWNSSMDYLGYHIGFTFKGGKITTGVGSYKGLKKGEYKIESGGSIGVHLGNTKRVLYRTDDNFGFKYVRVKTNIPIYTITKQLDANNWRKIHVYDAYHHNLIKDGKGVWSRPFDKNDGSPESACILPLNRAIMARMSLKGVTQLSISCKYLTFTAFKIVKKSFFSSGFFKILSVVAIVAIGAFFPPAGGLAGGAGILGANAAIGASLGLSGIAGIVAGAAINAIAGMVVTSIIQAGVSAIFGKKIGAIIGAVVSFAVIGTASGAINTGNFTDMLNSLMKADNLMSITSAVGKGYMQHINIKTNDIIEESKKVLEDISKKLDEVNAKMEEQLGTSGKVLLEPIFLTDVFNDFFQGESVDGFIERTLMTGSDVADTTLNFITNFADINLNLDLE